ncbi:kinase-like domain-containing protein, partial [Glomus cerebriforme]
ILDEAAEGLQRIHEQGFIHRDVHSGNFLVGKPEEVNALLTDLGLCRPANMTKKETLFGVLPFMAPELLHGGEYTQSTDVYGFSMVMYELASGIPP